MSSDRLTTETGTHPAFTDVDHHERVVLWEVDDAVVWRVIRAVPHEFEAFAADLEGSAVGEGLVGGRARRVVIAQQEPAGLPGGAPGDATPPQRGAGQKGGGGGGPPPVAHRVASAA